MMIKSIAVICVHTSPLEPLGGKKAGGMNVYVREMAREMGRRGVRVDVFTRRSSPDQPQIDHALGENVRVVYVNCGPAVPLDPSAVYPYLQEFTAGVLCFATKHAVNYDMVYAHYWLSGWVANKLKEVWGTPFAQMFHTLGQMKNRIAPADAPNPMPDERVSMEMRLMQWADCLIAATRAEYAQLLWLYRADRRKIAVVPPGVDEDLFKPNSRVDALQTLGYAPDERVMLFVGRIEPLKAIDSIIEAVKHIQHTEPELLQRTRFLIVGGSQEDPELARLIDMAAALGVGGLIDFLGAKDQHLLPTYYAAASAVIMPSDYESFGMVALEAMASGTPVIASHVGGLAYLVRDGETGYLVPAREPIKLAERIADVLRDPEAQARMGERAAETARTYAWSVIVDELLRVFNELLGGGRRVMAPTR
jgi:D-inositol-3-phosphate glycosyltransferase